MYYENLEERLISPQHKNEVAVRKFLAQFGMVPDVEAEYTIAVYFQDQIIATGSLVGEKLCSIAVDPKFRREGLAAKVVSNLIQEAGRRGRYRYLVKADLETEYIFLSLGFSKIAHVEPSGVLLAMGPDTILY